MPEGPEAHTIARVLSDALTGARLISLDWTEEARIEGCELLSFPSVVSSVWAKGKRPIIECSDFSIATFLGMTGRWSFERPLKPLITVCFDGGGEISHLYYSDTRKFGRVTVLASTEEALAGYLANIGPDLLSEPPSLEDYKKVITDKRRARTNICSFLMEQKWFSGIGNYLKSEILYASCLHHARTLGSLSEAEIARLHACSLDLIARSYQSGGLTISDYWSPTGDRGSFLCAVYGKSLSPDGRKVKKITTKDGRTTHYVDD